MASGGGVLAFLSARMTAPQGGARTLCVTAAAAATVDVQAVKERLPDSGWGTPRPASLPQTDFAIFSAPSEISLRLSISISHEMTRNCDGPKTRCFVFAAAIYSLPRLLTVAYTRRKKVQTPLYGGRKP